MVVGGEVKRASPAAYSGRGARQCYCPIKMVVVRSHEALDRKVSCLQVTHLKPREFMPPVVWADGGALQMLRDEDIEQGCSLLIPFFALPADNSLQLSFSADLESWPRHLKSSSMGWRD
ncbi:hypothetical protein B0H17DRAFT_1134023 [Mycena rosella]|uniref:Uncharacterized protein n=1 Tax=Mycena rosella TaxID=1033263 RepID=A0AAD7GHE0_MYCRO|nr:hypothetical protein B0H17DRAFT_1134023 [Mycena rosella]